MKPIVILLAIGVLMSAPIARAQVIPRQTRVGQSRTVDLVAVAAKAPAPVVANAKVEQVQAEPKKNAPEDRLQDAVNDKLTHLEAAIRGLNPSYAIAPVIGGHAATAGSFYIRVPAAADGAADAKKSVRVQLPPPVMVGRHRDYDVPVSAGRRKVDDVPQPRTWPPPLWPSYGSSSYGWPSWIYNGTIHVEGARPARALAVTEDEINNLRNEIRKLQETVEKLNKQVQPK